MWRARRSTVCGRTHDMDNAATTPVPTNHTADGGVLVGDPGAPRLIVFEDPQCPYCRQFEESSGGFLQGEVTRGALAIEYRMRCFLGVESIRADNAARACRRSGPLRRTPTRGLRGTATRADGRIHRRRPHRARAAGRPHRCGLHQGPPRRSLRTLGDRNGTVLPGTGPARNSGRPARRKGRRLARPVQPCCARSIAASITEGSRRMEMARWAGQMVCRAIRSP